MTKPVSSIKRTAGSRKHRPKLDRRTAKKSTGDRLGHPGTNGLTGRRPVGEFKWRVNLATQAHRLRQELIRAEQAAQSWANLFEAAPIAYLLLDENARIQEVNAEAERLFGRARQDILRVPLGRFVQKNELALLLDHLKQCNTTRKGSTIELSLRTSAAAILPVQMITAPVETIAFERVRLYRSMLVDMSRHHEAERALAHAQMNYKRLVSTVEGIVWEASAVTLDVTFVSQSAERLLGYRLEDWYQPGFWENHIYVGDRERVVNELVRAANKRQAVVLEYRVLTNDRRLVWLRDTVNVSEHEGQKRLLGIAVEVTSSKIVEQELQRTRDKLEERVEERTTRLREAVSELEAFSYSLSHDLRAPLRAMQGYAELLLRRLATDQDRESRDYLERIIRSSERLDALVRDVLQYSRVSRAPIQLAPVNPEKVVENVIRDYPNLQPPLAEIKIMKPLAPVCAHEVFLSQCVFNLLSNGVKFIRRGQVPHIRIFTETDQKSVQLCFQDNGIGIAPEDQRRIFGIFQRVYSNDKYEGTGIGLAIVQKAAERMRGIVGVESIYGQGSRFWLKLPRPE